jgi:hypothetical protein
MTPWAHRVRRQSWRVGVRSARDAFAARTRLRAGLEHELPQALGRAFDRAAPGAALVHIPRLELRLRVANMDALAGELTEALADAIERELRLRPPVPAQPPTLDRLEALLAYLATGTLAWHRAQDESPVVIAELRATLLENLGAVAPRGAPAGVPFEQAVQFYFRLLALVPLERWPQLAVPLESGRDETPGASAATGVIAAVLGEDLDLETWATPQALGLLRQAPQAALAALIALRPTLRHRMQRIAAVVLAAARMPDAALPQRAPSASANDPASKAPYTPDAPDSRGASPEPILARHDPRPPTLDAPASSTPVAAQPFALMAGNVGLVLLHPFLPRLFETCLLFKKNKLEKIETAAALLHWLATGREEVHELELGFVKLLLGVRPETPLAVSAGLLGVREREEGEALLAAAIGHWKALGKSSPDALRVAFLQRRGALREEEAGWRLQVEPESFDVLLGRLPWGLTTVKLPWMTRPLYTDWPTP